ncbi:MAG: hypothetical protein MZV70_45330 [Desulfobacterales bacterium]|nr:hypothetical protein [Desulfobacterales bacterium]
MGMGIPPSEAQGAASRALRPAALRGAAARSRTATSPQRSAAALGGPSAKRAREGSLGHAEGRAGVRQPGSPGVALRGGLAEREEEAAGIAARSPPSASSGSGA